MASDYAQALNQLGLDKSRANRILEPFLYVTDIISATDWENFWALRVDAGAQIEFQKLAGMMRETMRENEPLVINHGEWHLPLVHDFPYDDMNVDWDHWKRISAGRCARVSFDKQGEAEDHEATLARAARLIASGHLSPFEHVARPLQADDHALVAKNFSPFRSKPDFEFSLANTVVATDEAYCGNFRGWVQMRKEFANESNFGLLKKEEEPVA